MTSDGADPPLTENGVVGHLIRRGLLQPSETARARELSGGVSSVVIAVEADDRRLIVKQALPRLRTEKEWTAKRERSLTEAAALDLAAAVLPGATPALRDLDRRACALTIDQAPPDWRNWKDVLMEGCVQPTIGGQLGTLLGRLHSETAGSPALAARFDDAQAFRQLRLDPFYAEVARRHPDLRAAVTTAAAALSFHRRCLVHGDFSPKNVLVGNGGLWIVDWEVAHWGDPAFDLAFLLLHLGLKTIHGVGAEELRACAESFWSAYAEAAPMFAADPQYALIHVGCLMLARVDGKSPADYLTPEERERARKAGRSLIERPASSVAEAWARLEEGQG